MTEIPSLLSADLYQIPPCSLLQTTCWCSWFGWWWALSLLWSLASLYSSAWSWSSSTEGSIRSGITPGKNCYLVGKGWGEKKRGFVNLLFMGKALRRINPLFAFLSGSHRCCVMYEEADVSGLLLVSMGCQSVFRGLGTCLAQQSSAGFPCRPLIS